MAVNAQISGEKIMKIMKFLLVVLLAVTATSWAVVAPTSARSTVGQNQGSTALERGYRTGYSDGYQAGYSDQAAHAARDYKSKEEYKCADRAYVEAWADLLRPLRPDLSDDERRSAVHAAIGLLNSTGYRRQVGLPRARAEDQLARMALVALLEA